jgi:hypothetical protein
MLQDARVQEWLVEEGAPFAFMSDADFRETVIAAGERGLKGLLEQIDAERRHIEEELDKPEVKKRLFPTNVAGKQGKQERLAEAMRPFRQAAHLRILLNREYVIRRTVIEGYRQRLRLAAHSLGEDLSEGQRASVFEEEFAEAIPH